MQICNTKNPFSLNISSVGMIYIYIYIYLNKVANSNQLQTSIHSSSGGLDRNSLKKFYVVCKTHIEEYPKHELNVNVYSLSSRTSLLRLNCSRN